jgi:LacI family transcriptional regulator
MPELVIGQLLHNEFGIPLEPSLTTIPAKLIEGPTLRRPVAPPAPLLVP